MKLFLYIFKDYFKYVTGTLILCVFLFVLFDFIHKSTSYFPKYNPTTMTLFKYYAYQMPGQIVQALPIASLLASVIAMVLLSRANEVTAMRAVGMSPLRIGVPLAAGGLLLTGAAFFIGEAIIPKTAQKIHYVQQVLIEGEDTNEIAEGARWLRDGNRLFNFDDYDPVAKTLKTPKILHVYEGFKPKKSIEAQRALFNEETNDWTMYDIKVFHFKKNGTIKKVEYKKTRNFSLPVEPKKLKKDRRRPNELGIAELRDHIRRGRRSGADVQKFEVDFHLKLAYPFAAFVVSFVGLKFGYKSERATETVKGILIAFAIGISYWFILASSKTLGVNGTLHPFVAAWTANFVIFSIAIFDAVRAKKA